MERDHLSLPKRIGIVAGGRQFPILCAQKACEKGHEVYAICHKKETLPELEKYCKKFKWIRLGQLGKLISFFKKNDVNTVMFAGTITKSRLFFDVRPDWRAFNLWRRMKGHLDDTILKAVASELENEGIEVVSPTVLLDELLFPEGLLTHRKPTEQEQEDIKFGFELAKKIGQLDIGQCIVVKDKVVLAVEAIEGTDETIKRGGRLGGKGTIVVKICKPGQDTRFDLPAIGEDTIKTMKEVGATVLAVEANKALFFQKEKSIELANEYGISILGLGDS